MTKPPPTAATYRAKRSAFSLSPAEGVWAFAVAVGAWYLARHLGTVWPTPVALPVWLPFVLCNALGASALCAARFVLRVQTRNVSTIGYAALAFPFWQTLLIVPGWSVTPDVASLRGSLFLFLFAAHLAVSVAACIYGFCQKESRGDIAALPVFVGWFILLAIFVQGRSMGFALE